MRETLVVIGLVLLALGLRSSRVPVPRKLGAFMLLVASYLALYFIFEKWYYGFLGVIPWFLLPWIELLTRIKRMRLPMENRLRHQVAPDPTFFPNATEAASAMDEAGFEHVEDRGWDWSGMHQYFLLYWHPEERAEAAICLCEQGNVAFSFMSITSRDAEGNILRTTNFPFSPTLKCPDNIHWNHVPCEKNCFHQILKDHHEFLEKKKIDPESLRVPDPEEIGSSVEVEMKTQIRYNLDAGIIRPCMDDTHFEYSSRGLFFLWGQYLKDMIRLC